MRCEGLGPHILLLQLLRLPPEQQTPKTSESESQGGLYPGDSQAYNKGAAVNGHTGTL